MEGLYPSLEEKFRSEGICPICLMEMGAMAKYSCTNHHTICRQCKPYYYSCPTCRSPLDPVLSSSSSSSEMGEYCMPPAIHRMPQLYPPYPPSAGVASAPFIDHERHECHDGPMPTEDDELYLCQYSYLGCYARLPVHLKELHESRCQFRPQLEDEHLTTDLTVDEGASQSCKYHTVGCNVRLPEWRKLVHENLCIYKDKYETMGEVERAFGQLSVDHEDPEQMVSCRFSQYGCMVMMPRRKKYTHEMKCNYRRDDAEEGVKFYVPETADDPDEHVTCRWADYGCQVQPRRCRKQGHEEKCNYRRVECRFKEFGCDEMIEPSRKHLHENSCNYS